MNSKADMIREIKEVYNLHSPKILSILEKIPREEFVLDRFKHLAYEDTALSISEGQTISQPFTVAFMTQLLDLKGNEKVLEVGTGSGYQAAILASLTKEVFTIERIEKLAERARKIFKKLRIKNIHTKVGQGEKGWKEESLFDAIIITANTKKVPKKLFEQLKTDGRLVAPIGKGTQGIMTKYIKNKDKIVKQEYGSFSFVPLITS
jgi:protein-L-isoaspartate(D-aspartate) O-methyltransferase